MINELSNEEIEGQALLVEIDKEHREKRAAVIDMLARQKAERQTHVEQLQAEQDRLEKLAAQHRAQEALNAYTDEWRTRFTAQADGIQQWTQAMLTHLQALEKAGGEQDLHRQRAVDLLTQWAQGVASFSQAFDNPAQLQSWAVQMARELTEKMMWALPVSAEVRRTFRVTSAGWQSYGTPDVRRDVVVRALRRPLPPAPLPKIEEAPPPSELVDVTPETLGEDDAARKRALRNQRDRARRAARKAAQ